MRSHSIVLPFLCFLAPLATASANAAELNVAFESIRGEDVRSHVDVLADDSFEGREAGSRGGRAAGGYLIKHLQQFDLQPAGDDGGYFQWFSGRYRNILAMLPGSDPSLKDEIVVIGAHYDHVGYGTARNSRGPTGYIHNGADDNASGVAGLLEVVDAMTALTPRPKRSVLFAFWDGEEKGLLGSKHFAAYPTVPLDNIAMAINVDMIGRMKDRQITIYGTRSAAGLRRLISGENRSTELNINFTWEMKGNSDHYSFYERNIPVLMFHTGLHDDYHTPADDAHLINHQGAQQAARLLFRTAVRVANQPRRDSFRQAAWNEGPGDREVLEQPLPPAAPRMGVSWQPSDDSIGGYQLTHINPASAAERAGLIVGDRLLEVDGKRIDDEDQMRRYILASPASLRVLIQRDEAEMEKVVHLDGKPLRVGISWREDSGEPRTVVLSRVTRGSAADAAGLQAGDRVHKINGDGFRDGTEFLQLVRKSPADMELRTERNGRVRDVRLALPKIHTD